MYNYELKFNYIAGRKESIRNLYRKLFSRTEKEEETLGKDIACFSLEELANYFESLGFMEPDTLRGRITTLSVYGDWYKGLYPDAEPHFRDYHVEDFPYAKLFAPLVTKSPEELCSKMLMAVPKDSAQPGVAALCFAWLGIDCGDAIILRHEQVDTKHGKIFSPTGEVIVSSMPECIRDLLEVYEKTNVAERTQNRTFTVVADDIGYFIKKMVTKDSGRVGKPFKKEQIVNRIGYIQDEYNGTTGNDRSLNYTNVQRSGGFYRLHQMELAGVDVRSVKNADKVRMCIGKSKRNHKDNMLMYDAYLEVIGEK